MVKKMFYAFMALLFICAFTITTTPVYAQEEEEEVVEDVADISLEDLLNVEITTAGKRVEKVSEIPASVVVVTREDIEKYGYQSLPEILESIPGLYYTYDYFSRNFGVRGFWSFTQNHNMIILVNDVNQYEYLSGSVVLEQINIPIEAIDRVEVVRGPMSVIYGTGAFFGVINIFTNKTEDTNARSQIAAAGGSEATFKVFARAAGSSEDFQYSFNGSYYDTAGMDKPLAHMVSNPAILPFLGVPEDHTTKERLESKDKYFNFSGKYKGFSLDAAYSESDYESYILLPSLSDGALLSGKVLTLNFAYQHQFSEKARASARIGYFSNKIIFDYDFSFHATQENSSSGFRMDLHMFLDLSPNVSITLGGMYDRVGKEKFLVDIPIFGYSNYLMTLSEGESLVTQAVYTQFNLKLAERLRIIAGARLEQMPEYQLQLTNYTGTPTEVYNEATYSQTDIQFIPRAAIIWGIDENNYIKLLYGKAINRPTFFMSRDLLAYPTSTPLQPETIQTLEFNYIGTLSPKFTVNLSLFYNILDKLIYRSLFRVGSDLVSYFDNVGEFETTGAELTLQIAPSENFYLEISGTYQDTKDKRPGFEDIEVGYAPKFLGYIKAAYFFNKDISIAVTGNYVDKMFTYYDPTLNPPARLGQEVDGYFLLGANLRIRKLFGSGLFLNVRGSNLLNREIFYPTTSNNTWADLGTIGRGTTFLVTLGYKFIPIP